jgi:uncharacterized membrane protein
MKGKKVVPQFAMAIAVITALSVFLVSPVAWGTEKEKKDLPPRQILVAPEYSAVSVPEGEEVSIDLTVANQGRQDEYIDLSLPQVPKGWNARIKTYNFDVSGVFVASDKSKSLTLKLEPEKGTSPGKYTFAIKGQTQDGKLVSLGHVTVHVTQKEAEKKSKGVSLTTSYPVLQGPTDAKFEFSVEVENKSDKDATFNLNAQGPSNWDINFKPSYEDKLISSLRLKAGARQSVAVDVKPYLLAEPGKYPIQVKVSAPEGTGEAELNVILTGTHKIEVGTASGLLSLTAMAGKPASISFYVKNTGSAPQEDLKLLSFKPENWKVEFKPDKIDKLAPNELKQIELVITPSDQALVGDYSVAASVEGQKVSKNLEFRVTVKASTAWGWIGIAIIVLVVLGLVVLFVRMGRR